MSNLSSLDLPVTPAALFRHYAAYDANTIRG